MEQLVSNGKEQRAPSTPAITLPKGGGAIRGIGEKFAANPVTGTGSMTVPIATSPGRSGFGPELSLTYDSGAGNGPFGFGWTMSVPAVTRKMDKGLPQYHDAEESDVFVLAGAEDLVPVLEPNGTRLKDESAAPGYTIHRYRPRIEGPFVRIERWTRGADADVHWRVISRENVLTLYGKDENSRIADPSDPTRIFSWLICERRDDKGNAIVYTYKPEDGAGVDLVRVHERNRGGLGDARRAVNRYLKRVRYGNRVPLLDDAGRRPRALSAEQIEGAGWMFEVVFDYGEHDPDAPRPGDPGAWIHRDDAFSSYRAGFEVRTTRLCRRVLMFHHFEHEHRVGNDCLVRSTDFTYSSREDPAGVSKPAYTFLFAVTQTGYRRNGDGYLKRSLAPLEFEYSQPIARDIVQDVDPRSLEHLPIGVDGTGYQWTDLHGEGIPGILAEQADAWFYKRNISPISERPVEFAPMTWVATKPNLALTGRRAQFLDLAGDGQPDLVVLDGPEPGLYEHDTDEGWLPFRPFSSRLNRNTRDPNLRFVDLDGDGRTDVLITEDDGFVWHASLGEEGFSSARRVPYALDEDLGPTLVLIDESQSVYLADFSGDGLTDLACIRNGEICYWPNLGYGRFGAKVTMDNAPYFDHPDQFDHARIRLADIDGSGTIDIVYLHRDGVRLYFNQAGNTWSAPQHLRLFPNVDDVVVAPFDLLGNGTTCLVWSSPLPGDARRQLRYVDLMGGQKPHLLVKTVNNLGAETRVAYSSSAKFYLQDKRDGRPWITRLPFPVHVVERVETYDRISRNRFVTRYAYHHGYFDGEEREFRGFGMVEQWDSETMAALIKSYAFPLGDNVDEASHVPPVYTKSWFHTGIYLGRDHVSDFFAGLLDAEDAGEYYREPGLTDAEARTLQLPDTVLPAGLTLEEEREASRALKGAMLRQEVYALDGSPKAEHPYTVAEQNLTIRLVQPRGQGRHAVIFTHVHEALNYHYERNPLDPRVQHTITLEVDDVGNVLKEAAIAYGRRHADPSLPLEVDREKQTRTLITYTERGVTNSIDVAAQPDDYRTPVVCETRTYELTGYAPTGVAGRYQTTDFVEPDPDHAGRVVHIREVELSYEDSPAGGKERRVIEHLRTLYRKDDLTGLLALGELEPLAVSGESYKLAFTRGLLDQVYVYSGETLLPSDPADVLKGGGADRGGYVGSHDLKVAGLFPDADPDQWWLPSGRAFLSADANDTAAQELAYAYRHFFIPHRYRDPFHTGGVPTDSSVRYDAYDLLIVETQDALGNRRTAGERLPNGDLDPAVPGNDYRVLHPRKLMDSNRNRTQVAFDTLGMVVGTAVMGKPDETLGDSLDGFEEDLSEAEILGHLEHPLAQENAILGRATTRLVYDFFAYERTKNQPNPQPALVYTLLRDTHDADLEVGAYTTVHRSFAYSDGFGREIQKKVQAEPETIDGVVGPPRWVSTGWTIFNNKGNPVRRYEPFFSATHHFEFGVQVGVSAVLFYDPTGRVVATLHPNHTYEKVVFDPWAQSTWDANDTVLGNPRTDSDIGGFTKRYFAAQPPTPDGWQTWHEQRRGGALGRWEQAAAAKAEAHAETPTKLHFDALGRPFMTMLDNGVDADRPERHLVFATRVELDIEGNQRAIRDAVEQAGDHQGRIVMRYAYDLLSNRIHQFSMEAGRRWTLNDVAGKTIRAWDSRGHSFRTEYDPLRRPQRSFVSGTDPTSADPEMLTERLVYGEQHPDNEARNLREKLYLHLDQAGALTAEAHDFKGNPLRSTRGLAREYKRAISWTAVDAVLPTNAHATLDVSTLQAVLAPLIETDIYMSDLSYDALNRPMTVTTPHTTTMAPSIVRSSYNEATLLERLEVNVRGATAGGKPLWTPFVTNIDYDAQGRRRRVVYGNGVTTSYDYDPFTFGLRRIVTRRPPPRFPDDCPESPPVAWPGCHLQDLSYTYDPVGNIIHLGDDAQQTIFFHNRRVEPSSDYTYDAVYRLIEATGREHLGLVGGEPIPHSYDDTPRVRVAASAKDGNAVGAYIERYVYDAVGNLLEMQHRGTDPAHPGWTRHYTYDEASLTEDGARGTVLKTNNRLSRTTVGTNNPSPELYVYDAHGNMTRMPHLSGTNPSPNIHWDYRDRMRQVDLGGGGTTFYVYDASGQRVRKVWEKSATLIDERLYLGGFEIYRQRRGADRLERESLHVMDDKQRVTLIETRTLDTAGDDPAPAQIMRYQLGNHLGSASIELDDQAQIISYEEYTPYGSTSYQAVRSQTETPKRYRFTGKERDNETGLYYYGGRYYPPWIGRWISCDPLGLIDGTCLYRYAKNEPTNVVDQTGHQAGPWQPYINARQLETAVNEAAAPIVNSGPVQFSSGVVDAIADTASGMVTGTWDRLVRTADEIADHPAYLVSGPVGLAAAMTVAEGRHQINDVQARAAAQGGGFRGWYVAVNQQWNPAYGIFEHGDRAIEAARRGDWHGAGGEVTNAGVSVASTVLLAESAGAAMESAATRLATPRPAAPRAPARVAGAVERPPAPARVARAAEATESAPVRVAAAQATLSTVEIVSTMERHVATQNARVATAIRGGNRGFFENLGMSQDAINVLMNPRSRTFAAQYGNAMERAVARAFRSDPSMSGMLLDARNMSGRIFPTRPSGRPLRPDFGFSSGPFEGQIVDLTTTGGRAMKMEKYHDRVITLEYTRPTF